MRARVRRLVSRWSPWRAAVVGLALLPAVVLASVADGPRAGLTVLVGAVGLALASGLLLGDLAARVASRPAGGAEPTGSTGTAAAPEGVERRLVAVEEVLTSVTRWTPDVGRLPWTAPEEPCVLLLVAADYHLAELHPLAAELHRRGVPTRLACGEPHWPRVRDAVGAVPGLSVHALPPRVDPTEIRAVVTMADWGGYRDLVDAANVAGVTTFGKVEGVVDAGGVDASEAAERYRRVRWVLAQGRWDARIFGEDRSLVVGSSRLEALWLAPAVAPARPLVVVNQNFTYGVFTAERTAWLRGVTEACEREGLPYVVSLHPADKARSLHPHATPLGISQLLPRATLLISRFSAAPLEALARGVPFVYFNPHGERVPDFAAPDGAFGAAGDLGGLRGAIAGWCGRDPAAVRAVAESFWRDRVEVVDGVAAHVRTADAILERWSS